jgi:hypothetical protein
VTRKIAITTAGGTATCQEELLPQELQSAQAQATQSDLILEFRKQGFHLLSFPLCLRELWCVDQLARALPGRLIRLIAESRSAFRQGPLARREQRAVAGQVYIEDVWTRRGSGWLSE